MGETAPTAEEQKLMELAAKMDAEAPIGYQIRKAGRFNVYATKMYRYRPRHAVKIKSFKTLKEANKYLSKKLTIKKEKHEHKNKAETNEPRTGSANTTADSTSSKTS